MVVIAVDPGVKGGIALLNTSTNIMLAAPTPMIGKEIDYRKVHETLMHYSPDMIVIEKVHAMPKQGVTSMFNFGMGYGALVALATVSTARVVLVTHKCGRSMYLQEPTKIRMLLYNSAILPTQV